MSLKRFTGWLLDLYLDPQNGLKLWFISAEDDSRVCFTQAFPVSFFASGENQRLRALWKRLDKQEGVIKLVRTQNEIFS